MGCICMNTVVLNTLVDLHKSGVCRLRLLNYDTHPICVDLNHPNSVEIGLERVYDLSLRLDITMISGRSLEDRLESVEYMRDRRMESFSSPYIIIYSKHNRLDGILRYNHAQIPLFRGIKPTKVSLGSYLLMLEEFWEVYCQVEYDMMMKGGVGHWVTG